MDNISDEIAFFFRFLFVHRRVHERRVTCRIPFFSFLPPVM